MQKSSSPICFLFDNGSLRPAATLQLRQVAERLTGTLGVDVRPVSLLHSSGVDPAELGGQPARLLEPAVLDYLARYPEEPLVMLPFFFASSRALTEYLPERMAGWQKRYPGARLRVAKPLAEPGNTPRLLVSAFRESIRETCLRNRLTRPAVVLVDHGSPVPEVTAVRDDLGRQLRDELGAEVRALGVASMERRAGAEYDFNEPLLERCLLNPPFDDREVVVALQFLAPGRHAGEDGDVATLCAAARRERPRLKTFLTQPVGAREEIIELLKQRYREAL